MATERRTAPTWVQFRGIIAYSLGPVLGLASGPILARVMGPEGRGEFATIMQPLTVAGALAGLGVPAATTYFIASRRNSPTAAYRRGLCVVSVPSLAVFAFMVWYSGVVSETQPIARYILVLAWTQVVAQAVVSVRRGYWQGLAGWAVLDRERSVFAVLRFAAIAVLALIGVSAASLFAAGALAAFVVAAALLWSPVPNVPARAPARGAGPTSESDGLRPFLLYSLATSAGTICIAANSRLDQMLMPGQVSSREIGLYAVAVTVAEVPLILATLAGRDALQMSGAGASARDIARHSALHLGLMAGLALLLGTCGAWYVPIVFGRGFEAAVPVVTVLSIASVLNGVAVVIGAVINGRGRPTLGSAIPIAGLLVTLVGFASMWGHVDAWVSGLIGLASQGVSAAVALVVLATPRRTRVRQKDKGVPA
ncbi:lipopolysaccharide biosynthesis protein [Xylanimonas allomyrinae]|nr:oligosaccharide flippase family protein [Xylanimonas allomyrinae]